MEKVFFLVAIAVITIAACKTSKETAKTEKPVVKPAIDCSTAEMTFVSIKPIFEKNCTGCHGYGGQGGYNFESLAEIKRAAKNGDLLGAIKHARGFPKMPAKAEQLDQASINQIECWINNGMKE